MTGTCDEAGALLEKERHVGLEPEEQRALEAHLAGCDRCRAEQTDLGTLEEALAVEGERPRTGWPELKARMEAIRKRQRRDLWIGAGVALSFGAVVLIARGVGAGLGFDDFGSGFLIGLTLTVAAVLFAAFRSFRRLEVIPLGEELVTAIRARLLRKLRGLRFFTVFSPLYVAGIVWWQPAYWGTGVAGVLIRVGITLFIVGLALYGWLWRRPRLLADLKSLEARP
jgi:predicted anti-sigma-YlaC factor YlaD